MSEVVRATVVKTEKAVLEYGWGKGRTTDKILKQTWSDGIVDFKCVDCDFTHEKFQSVFSHRTQHAESRKVPKAPKMTEDESSLNEALILLKQVEGLMSKLTDVLEDVLLRDAPQEDPWKERALEAEKQLARIRKLIGQ